MIFSLVFKRNEFDMNLIKEAQLTFIIFWKNEY